jgi:hypothetical protein
MLQKICLLTEIHQMSSKAMPTQYYMRISFMYYPEAGYLLPPGQQVDKSSHSI